jgi:predicted transcriptional regulator
LERTNINLKDIYNTLNSFSNVSLSNSNRYFCKNETMEQRDIKTDLHALIDKTNDVQVLEAIKVLLHNKNAEQDFWDSLPESQKKSIERGLAQAERGESKPHEEIRKKYEKWLTK